MEGWPESVLVFFPNNIWPMRRDINILLGYSFKRAKMWSTLGLTNPAWHWQYKIRRFLFPWTIFFSKSPYKSFSLHIAVCKIQDIVYFCSVSYRLSAQFCNIISLLLQYLSFLWVFSFRYTPTHTDTYAHGRAFWIILGTWCTHLIKNIWQLLTDENISIETLVKY